MTFSLDQVSKSKGCDLSLSLNAKTGDSDNGSGDFPSVTTMEFFLGVLHNTAFLVIDEDLGTNCFGNLSMKLDLYSLPSVCLLLLLCFEINLLFV